MSRHITIDVTADAVLIRVSGDVFWLSFSDADKLRRLLNDNSRKLRPLKNWNACPYERHSDDCDCNGAGGDR